MLTRRAHMEVETAAIMEEIRWCAGLGDEHAHIITTPAGPITTHFNGVRTCAGNGLSVYEQYARLTLDDRKLFHYLRKSSQKQHGADADDEGAGPGPGTTAAQQRQRSGLRRGMDAGASGSGPDVRRRSRAVTRAYRTAERATDRMLKRLAKHGVTAHILSSSVLQGFSSQPRTLVTQPCMAALRERGYFQTEEWKAMLMADPQASQINVVVAWIQAAAAGAADGRAPPTDAGGTVAATCALLPCEHAHRTCVGDCARMHACMHMHACMCSCVRAQHLWTYNAFPDPC